MMPTQERFPFPVYHVVQVDGPRATPSVTTSSDQIVLARKPPHQDWTGRRVDAVIIHAPTDEEVVLDIARDLIGLPSHVPRILLVSSLTRAGVAQAAIQHLRVSHILKDVSDVARLVGFLDCIRIDREHHLAQTLAFNAKLRDLQSALRRSKETNVPITSKAGNSHREIREERPTRHGVRHAHHPSPDPRAIG